MSGEAVALGLIFLIHAIGLGVLLGGMLRSEGGDWRDWWPRDDDGPGGGPDDRGPEPGPPLAGAEQSGVRLREPGRLGDARRRPSRRPEHPPRRVPQRERI